MYCKNCGNANTTEDKFCKNCGTSVENNINNQPTMVNTNNKWEKPSKVIGIISVIAVFLFQILIIPLAIVGLVLGLKTKKITNKINPGIILNLIAIIIAIPIFMIYDHVLLNDNEKEPNTNINNINNNNNDNTDTNDVEKYHNSTKGYFLGTWNCASPTSPTNYTFVVKLDNNDKYIAGQYGDLDNNYATGKYEFTYNDKPMTAMSDYIMFWFNLEFITTDKFVMDGVDQGRDYNAKFEVGRFVGTGYTGKNITLASTNGANIYICEKGD